MPEPSAANPDELILARPYSPGWVNLLIERVERLPGAAWMYYAGLGILLALLMTTALWQARVYPVGEFSPIALVLSADIALASGLIAYFTRAAREALMRVRPGLDITDAQFAELRYRFSVMPARTTLFWSLLTVSISVSRLIFEPSSRAIFPLEASSAIYALSFGMIFIFGAIAGPFIYLMLRILREINRTFDRYARINLFEAAPFYAFSGLTARMAFALVFLTTLNFAVVPFRLNDPVDIGFILWSAVIAGAVFIVPLFGIHNRLADEKARLLGETAQRIQLTIAEQHRIADAKQFADAGNLNDLLGGLEIENRTIEHITTWPWQADTFRFVITALFFPIVLFVIQFTIQKLLTP